MSLSLPIQNGSRFIQLLGVLLCFQHVIGQTAITQALSEVADFTLKLVSKWTQFFFHFFQLLQTENRISVHFTDMKAY